MAHDWSRINLNSEALCLRCGLRIEYVVEIRTHGHHTDPHPRAKQYFARSDSKYWEPSKSGVGLPRCAKGGAAASARGVVARAARGLSNTERVVTPAVFDSVLNLWVIRCAHCGCSAHVTGRSPQETHDAAAGLSWSVGYKRLPRCPEHVAQECDARSAVTILRSMIARGQLAGSETARTLLSEWEAA
jgi:hypothetical protein